VRDRVKGLLLTPFSLGVNFMRFTNHNCRLGRSQSQQWCPYRPRRRLGIASPAGDRTYKLPPITTSEYGRYVKSLGEPRGGQGGRGYHAVAAALKLYALIAKRPLPPARTDASFPFSASRYDHDQNRAQ